MTKDQARPVLIWFPKVIFPSLDAAIRAEDSDRSKFIRNAVREKLSRLLGPKPAEVAR